MLLDTSVVQPKRGHFLWRPVTTTAPVMPTVEEIEAFATDTSDLPAGFENYGHTSLDEAFAPNSDGGETEVKGSWQNPALMEVTTSEAVDYFVVKSMQIGDAEVQKDFNGGGTTGDGYYEAPALRIPRQKEIVVVFLNTIGQPMANWYPLTSVRAEGPMEVASDDFIYLPLRFTRLQRTGAPVMRVISSTFTAAP